MTTVTRHNGRRRRREFLDFMNEVVAAHLGAELRVILDNLRTHKPKDDRWLARHKDVHLHYTPTHASWLNGVEVWFSILKRRALDGASHTSPRDVRPPSNGSRRSSTRPPPAFEWQKREVHQIDLSRHYADLR